MRVDGVVLEQPQARVAVPAQIITLDPGASLAAQPPVTMLLHKAAGVELELAPMASLLQAELRVASDHSGVKFTLQHMNGLVCVTPLEDGASGLVVFTKDHTIRRKLLDDAARLEQELIVEVQGSVSAEQLAQLKQAASGQAAAKVSITHGKEHSTGLRFALNANQPGRISSLCAAAGLEVTAMKRIRVGRVALAALPLGQWRYLVGYERF